MPGANGAGNGVSLPTDPSAWINSGPIAAETLQGKSALLYYFEETCPSCRARWPSLLEMSKQFEDKPIVFIAVNSGNSREEVAAYAKEVKCTWPILVDPSRQFERDSGLPTPISLQNIMQVQFISADGKLGQGSWKDVPGTIEKALAGAKWNIDPTGLPKQLLPVVRGLEFNTMSAIPAPLKAGLTSADPAVKAGAEQLNGLLQAKIAADLQASKAAYAAGEKWKSYKLVNGITQTYAGIELPEAVNKAKTALSADEAVRTQLNAARELESLKKRARTAPPAAQRGLVKQLKDLADKYADTEAGVEAKALLAATPQN